MSHYITISFLKIPTLFHRLTHANIPFEETLFKATRSLLRGGQQRWQREFCSEERVKHRQPTNGTVLSVPSLATFTLAILTGAVLGAAGVAGPLVAGCARPALLAATGAAHAHAVRTAVRRAELCTEREAGQRGCIH